MTHPLQFLYSPVPDTPPVAESRFTRRVGSFTLGTLISRIFGVVRESVFACLFGASAVTDAFNVAFRIPNVLRDLFAESALSAAFVPTFVDSLKHREQRDTWRFAASMFNVLAIAVGAAVLLGVVFAPDLVSVIASGFRARPDQFRLTVLLTRIMFPFLLFVVFAAWAMGILNASGSFFVPAVAPAAFNVVSALFPLLTYGFFAARGEPIQGMAWGVVIGAVAQFIVQVPSLRRRGFRWQPAFSLRDPRLVQVFRRWLPMLLGLGTWQVNFMVNTFLLTFLSEGSVTWVNYAYRIQHLPAGLFGVAIGSVAVAEYSHLAAEKNAIIRDRFSHAMRLVSVLTLPAALILIALAVPVTRLVYQRGAFTAVDTLRTAQALMLYCLGIWSASATRNCAAGFYSLGDTRTPALVALGVVSTNIALNLVLMRVIGFLSFPLSASLTQTANFAVLFLLLRRRTGRLDGRRVTGITLLAIACAIAGALVAFGCSTLLDRLLPGARFPLLALALLASAGAGIAVYYLAAIALRVREVRQAFHDLITRQRTGT